MKHPSVEDVAGSYSSFSESEWDLTLELGMDGDVKIIHEAWAPGEREKGKTVAYSGRWSIENGYVRIISGETYNMFRYEKNLSMKEVGLGESRPGLKPIDPKVKMDLIRSKFWRKMQ